MRPLLVLFILLLATLKVSAQNQVLIDSLERRLKASKTADAARVDALNALAFEYRSVDIPKSFALLDEAIHLAKKINDRSGLALAYNHKGILFKNKKQFDSSIAFHHKALVLRQQIKEQKGIASSFNNLGLTYSIMGDYTQAMSYHLKSLRLREEMNDTPGMAAAYNNIGQVHYSMHDFPQAAIYASKAIDLRETTGDSFAVAELATGLGFLYYQMSENDKAIATYNRALRIFEQTGNVEGIASILINIGNVYNEQKNYSKAIQTIRKALDLQIQMQDTSGIAYSYISLTQAYANMDDFESALYYGSMAKPLLAVTAADLKMSQDFYEVMALVYRKKGDYKQAIDAYIEYNKFKDSILHRENRELVNEMQVKYETEKKDLELSQKNLALENTQHKLDQRRLVSTFLIILIIVLIALGYLFYNRYKLKKRQELDAEIIRQQELRSKAIIETEEKERIRIARDLHDGLGQQLSAIKMRLSTMESEIRNSEVQIDNYTTVVNMVDDAVREVRAISHNMMPNALLRLGLASAIREFIDKIAGSGPLKVDLQIVGLENRLEHTTETVMYRVLQECVANIIKHAAASYVNIQLLQYDGYLQMLIEDNGRGFSTDLINNFQGIGLKNIVSRVEYLNGTVTFDSTPGKGTTVIVEIPVGESSKS
jgi:signal transduction histidine kinase